MSLKGKEVMREDVCWRRGLRRKTNTGMGRKERVLNSLFLSKRQRHR
jgi:hypothetical protein